MLTPNEQRIHQLLLEVHANAAGAMAESAATRQTVERLAARFDTVLSAQGAQGKQIEILWEDRETSQRNRTAIRIGGIVTLIGGAFSGLVGLVMHMAPHVVSHR